MAQRFVYPSTPRPFPLNSSNCKLFKDYDNSERVSNLIERAKEAERMAALRATAPPLNFLDHLKESK